MKVLVIGASLKPARVSHRAIQLLRSHRHEVEAIGSQSGQILDVQIKDHVDQLDLQDIHTITLYINPKIQEYYKDLIVKIKPKRVIFNPGTENEIFARELGKSGIFSEDACTLVLLNTRQF